MKKKLSISEQVRMNSNEYIKASKGEKNKANILKIKVLDKDIYNSQAVVDVRDQLGLTQTELSLVLGVSPRTVESWEQGRSKPNGSAQRLLTVVKQNPSVVDDIITVETVSSTT